MRRDGENPGPGPHFVRTVVLHTTVLFTNPRTAFSYTKKSPTTMPSPIYLRNPLRLSPLRVISRISSTYSTNSNRAESNRSDRIPTNDPSPPPPVPNVSETNAVPSSTWGQQDALLQEEPEAAEQRREMQAPNRQNVWSRSQERREVAMRGPRFEQTIMELQVGGTLFSSSDYCSGLSSGIRRVVLVKFIGEVGGKNILEEIGPTCR